MWRQRKHKNKAQTIHFLELDLVCFWVQLIEVLKPLSAIDQFIGFLLAMEMVVIDIVALLLVNLIGLLFVLKIRLNFYRRPIVSQSAICHRPRLGARFVGVR